jgi:hypothetical protein
MKNETLRLVELIKEQPEAWFIHRSEDNYDLFLDLYQRVGYAPGTPPEIASWKARSCQTWRMQDSILPKTCTGGLNAGRAVSSWGTLPKAKNILYGHSVCMDKTLASAATLFAQSLYSVAQMERYPEIGYWAGSYANHSRFTSLFQRPNAWKITGQLELEVIRTLQPNHSHLSVEPQLAVKCITKEHLECISSLHLEWFGLLCEESPWLANLHSCKSFALTDHLSGKLKCVAIAQTVPAEFTAANVFAWTWIFPAHGVEIGRSLFAALRSVPQLQAVELQVALNGRSHFESNDLSEPTQPAFWALTPRSQIDALRDSFEEAFRSLFDRYTADDLEGVPQICDQR